MYGPLLRGLAVSKGRSDAPGITYAAESHNFPSERFRKSIDTPLFLWKNTITIPRQESLRRKSGGSLLRNDPSNADIGAVQTGHKYNRILVDYQNKKADHGYHRSNAANNFHLGLGTKVGKPQLRAADPVFPSDYETEKPKPKKPNARA